MYNGEVSNFAFVSYNSYNEANNARNAADHSMLLGKEIRVQFKTNATDFKPEANLFINNLSKDLSAKALEHECEQFGNVLSCKFKYDSEGVPIGYGYVQFENKEDADKCIEALNGKVLNDKAISVTKFVPRSKRQNELNPNKNLFVRNFPADWEEANILEFIKEYFGKYGETTSTAVCLDRTSSGKDIMLLLLTQAKKVQHLL